MLRPAPVRVLRTLLFSGLLLATAAELALATEPLHARIDALIAAKLGGPASPRADDAEFVRRLYLDLTGRIPSTAEARKFLERQEANKRELLIDELLQGPDYPRRMSELFNQMLMERLGTHADWEKYLADSFAKDKTWDQLAKELLAPNPDDEQTRGSALFLSKRLENYGQNPVDFPALTRDLGRMFLGVDLQCAQCHDHPHIKDYKQVDFQGLFTFIKGSSPRQDVKFPAVGESLLDKKTEYMSVFVQVKQEVGPRVPFMQEVAIPSFAKGEEFARAPDKKTRFPGQPKFSPLSVLADQLPTAQNEWFKKNAANRFWFVVMGRGLVHPLDLDHSANPPSHPELLTLLADEFAAGGFQIKSFLKELLLTETYQRSSVLPEGQTVLPLDHYQTALERGLSPEQLLRSMLQATGELDRALVVSQEKGAVKYSDLLDKFLKAFANPPREPELEFMPSVKAALFVLNEPLVLSWLEPRAGNLVERLTAIQEPAPLANELYLSVLSRQPTDTERNEVATYLSRHTDRRTVAVGHLVWSLLASTEFAVNH